VEAIIQFQVGNCQQEWEVVLSSCRNTLHFENVPSACCFPYEPTSVQISLQFAPASP
jgi:hypothetical protein